ncbi:MAG: hypothetical protein R3F30_10025 [Planctomycetota bacterium]
MTGSTGVTGVEPRGSFFAVDAQGFLINPCRRNLIQPRWDDAVQAVIDTYRQRLGPKLDSVYLRGSVPCGTAIEGVSDLDSVALVLDQDEAEVPDWALEADVDLCDRFPFVSGFELWTMPRRTLLLAEGADPFRFVLKTQGLCVEGPDILPELPRCRVDGRAIQHLPHLAEDLEGLEDDWAAGVEPVEAEEICTWMCKRLVRAGLELVLPEEGRYSRDLWPCYEAFSSRHPDMEPAMRQALEWAVRPTDMVEPVRRLSHELVDWFGRQPA